MGMTKTIAEIKKDFEDRGLSFEGGIVPEKPHKMDYIIPLMKDSLRKRAEQGTLRKGCEWVHANVISPQLALSQSGFKSEDEYRSYCDNPDYFGEIKWDGERSYCVFTPEDGLEFFSRNRSVSDYLFNDYTDQVKGLGSAEFRGFFKKSFVLDAEMVSINANITGRIETLTPLQAIVSLMALNREDSWKAQEDAGYPIRWHVFDIIMYDGVNLMGCPQWERDQCLAKVMAEIARAEKQFNLPQLGWFLPKETFEGNYEQLKAKFDEVIAQGGEGLVIKNRNAPYVANERRSKDRWFKMKRDFNSATGSDIDAFVTGFGLGTEGKGRENLVSSLYLSVYLMPSEEVHEVARVTGLTLEEMQEATVIGADGKPTLNPEWYNRVFTVEGQNFSGREMRLQHARFPNGLRASYRPDKNPGECQLDSAVMNDLIL